MNYSNIICKFILLMFLSNFLGMAFESYQWGVLQKGKFVCHYGRTRNPLYLLSCSYNYPYFLGVLPLLLISKTLLKKANPVIKIIVYSICAGLAEIIAGLVVNKKYTHWDYRKNFGNIMGHTDVYHMIIWGIGAYLVIDILIPFLDRTVASKICNPVTAVILVIIVIITFIGQVLQVRNKKVEIL